MKVFMKNFLSIFIILNFFLIVIDCNISIATTREEYEKAIQEVAYSYYKRGANIEYNSMKNGYFQPEDATNHNMNYLVCSGFTGNEFKELLGITIPYNSINLISYTKKYIGNRPEVILYGKKNKSGDMQVSIYNATAENGYDIKMNPDLSEIIPLVRTGDILTFTGHAVLIYDVIYNKSGEVEDALIIQTSFGGGKTYVQSKIPMTLNANDKVFYGSANYFLYHNTPLINYENWGTGRLGVSKLSKYSYWKNINNNDAKDEYSILRFVDFDEDKEAVLNLYETRDNKLVKNHENEKIELSDKIKDRLKYSRLYIEKLVDKHVDNVVQENDRLIYTIIIKNNSNEQYTEDIEVTEKISDCVTYDSYNVNKDDVQFTKDDVLKWNIGKLKAGEEVRINYSVFVKEGYRGKTIESTGLVGNIPIPIIKNVIGNNLGNKQKYLIKEKFEELKASYDGKELINEIYKQALQVDLHLNSFSFSDLINDTNPTKSTVSTISLKAENEFYPSILNKYWNKMTSTSYSLETENDIIFSTLKYWEQDYTEESRRADTVYEENFNTGDILIYQNTNDVIYAYNNNKLSKTPITYENGEYAYVYIEGKGFVGVNFGNDRKENTQDDRNQFSPQYYKDNNLKVYYSKDEKNGEITEEMIRFMNYQTLFGKDYYVILRPSLLLESEGKNYSVNGECFESLLEAYNAITSKEGIIKVLKDTTDNSNFTIEQGKTITLDTNGKTVIKTDECIHNKGSLTIKGNGKILSTEAPSNKITSLIINYGTLNIENVTIENKGHLTKNWYTIFRNGGSINIKSGTIKATTSEEVTQGNIGRAITIKDGEELNITGGTIISDTGCAIFASATSAGSPAGTINITNGVIECTGTDNAVTISKNDDWKNNIIFNAVGGTFKSSQKAGISNTTQTVKITLGRNDEKVSIEAPKIQGKTYAIISSNGFSLYDGILKGGYEACHGTINSLPEDCILIKEQTDEGQVAYLQNMKYQRGDMNNDGLLTLIDVRLLLQKVINNEYTEDEYGVLDYNGDDKISLIDVRLLLQRVING